MEMTKRIQIQVGIFFSLGLVLILGSIMMLGADKALFKKFIYVTSEFDQVQGLNEGSVVSLSGVVAGNVHQIDFNQQTNMLTVTMKLEKSFAEKLTRSAQVEIRTQGALGDKFIFIVPGNNQDPKLESGDKLQVAKATDIIGIFSERGKDSAKIFDIINEIYAMIRSVNSQGRIEKIMSHMTDASQNLNSASADVRKFAADLNGNSTQNKLKSSIEKFDNILSKIDRGEGTLGALINDPTLHNQLKSIVGGQDRKKPIKTLIRTSIEKADGGL